MSMRGSSTSWIAALAFIASVALGGCRPSTEPAQRMPQAFAEETSWGAIKDRYR